VESSPLEMDVADAVGQQLVVWPWITTHAGNA
jgi:hypothetical protein